MLTGEDVMEIVVLRRQGLSIVGKIFKIAGLTLIGFSFSGYGPAIVYMIPAALISTRLGKATQDKMSKRYFLMAFRTMLVVLALKLFLVDGLTCM